MIDKLTELIRGKRILILGFGMEGRSTYKLLRKLGSYSCLNIADVSPPEDIPDSVIFSGDGYLSHIPDYDIVFKSPGVVLPGECRQCGNCITSQTELFLQTYGKQTIGVTGTKGKSTVSSLLHHVLSSNNLPSILAGNIGKPVFDIIDDINAEAIIVLELSSHQLEICNYSPATAVFLNIYEDHLDHYGAFEKYFEAKKNIYRHQDAAGVLYCGGNVAPCEDINSRVIVITRDVLPFDSFDDIEGCKLRGMHNLTNCAFVYSIAKSYGVTDEQFAASLKTFTPLRHRLEYIGSKDGVDYFDDSISTTAESAISAIESIPNASAIILGGMDRGINYEGFAGYLAASKLSHIICMYESGRRIYDLLCGRDDVKPRVVYCSDLTQAAKTAAQVTPSGTACILSPASASYGDFKNFEQRGDCFRNLLFNGYYT